MDEIGKSIAEAIRKRTATSAFGSYVFFWSALHWQGIYTTLFTSEEYIKEKFGLLKNEYVNTYFFGYDGGWDWSFILGFLIPLLLMVLFIWPLPKYALVHLYRIEQEHKTERRKLRAKEEQKVVEYERKLTEKKTEAVDAQILLAEKQQQAEQTDPAIVWQQEFEEFKKDPAFTGFGSIMESVYKHGGHIRVTDYNGNTTFEVPAGILALGDAKGLINIDNSKRRIELTPKGKYFVGRHPHWAR